MGKYSAASEAEYGSGDEFKNLPEDDYILELREVPKSKTDVNPFSKTEENPEGEMRTQLQLSWQFISFADGEGLVDVEGVPQRDRRITDFIDPAKAGFRSGVPSKTRTLFAALTGTPIRERLDVPDEEEWVGMRVIGTVIHKSNGRMGIQAYKPTKRVRPARREEPAAENKSLPGETRAKAQTDDVTAKAQEVFGEDLKEF